MARLKENCASDCYWNSGAIVRHDHRNLGAKSFFCSVPRTICDRRTSRHPIILKLRASAPLFGSDSRSTLFINGYLPRLVLLLRTRYLPRFRRLLAGFPLSMSLSWPVRNLRSENRQDRSCYIPNRRSGDINRNR
jgi:hypothetical protein